MQQAAQPAGGLPLAMTGTGSRVRIEKLGGNQETRHHLERLGFTTGEVVRVVNQAAGNLILDVRGSRIGLSGQLAAKIRVTPL